MRTPLASVALVLMAVALAAPVLAQPLNPEIRITSSAATLQAGPQLEEARVSFTVVNLGPRDGSVSLSAAPVSGWRFDWAEDSRFTLAPNGQKTIALVATAAEGAKNGTLDVSGTLSEQTTGRESPKSSTKVALQYVPTAPVPPPPPRPPTPWQPFAAGTGALLFGLLLFQAGSVSLELSDSRLEVTPAGSGYVRVTVRNRWWPARRVFVRVRDIPSPAVAAFSLTSVRLRRGESVTVPLLVKAPSTMADGTQSLSVQARAGRLGPYLSRRRVRLTIRSPVEAGAPLEQLKPVIVPGR